MKITTSVQLTLVAAGAAFVILSGSVFFAYSAQRDSNDQRQQLYAIVIGTAELQIRTDEYLKSFSVRPLRQWQARNTAIVAALNNIKPSAIASRHEIASLSARHKEISQLFFQLQQLGLPGEDRNGRMHQQLLVDRLFIKYEEQLGEIAHLRQLTLDADQQKMQRSVTFSVLALALLTCIFLAALYIVRRNLSAPIQKLVEATEALGLGDLGHRIEQAPDNEIGTLSEAVNTMAARLQNVTAELKNTHEKLRQAQKMEAIGQLTGGIAHDFNNILAGMQGNLEIMRMRITQDRTQDIKTNIDSALSLTDRAAALTHRLLAFSRQQALDPKPTDVNVLVESMLPLIEQSVGPHITLTFNQQDAVWHVLSDTHQLENALLNLAINSRDAMPDGGTLTIETANMVFDDDSTDLPEDIEPGQYVCLRVIDTGCGMSPSTMTRAFDPFFTTKPSGQGTGLGLSMIYGFIKQSEGHVRIHSVADGGTTVQLYLPRYELATPNLKDVDQSHETEFKTPPQGVTRQATVLVVDDEPELRLLLVEMVRELGYKVLEAEDSNSAMKLLESTDKLNLLVTDIGLPNGMNGRQLAEAARGQRPELQILFITGYAQNAIANNDVLASGMEIMTKPFSMANFASKVRSMVEQDVDSKKSQSINTTDSDNAKQLTILVVDDNVEAATCLAMLLEANGHKLQVAHDGLLGLEAAKEFMPDVVLMDIGMPVMDGYEAAQEIRRLPALAHIKLVALTGWGSEEDRLKSKDAGFDYHLTKPAELATIRALLSQLDKPIKGELGKL